MKYNERKVVQLSVWNCMLAMPLRYSCHDFGPEVLQEPNILGSLINYRHSAVHS